MSRTERNERVKALKPWKIIGWMMVLGLIGYIMNPIWTPIGMCIGFILATIYYNLLKGE